MPKGTIANFSNSQHYNHVAHTAKDNGLAEYKRWVESHSVEEITIANTARRTLRRRFPSEKGTQKKWVAIQDERLVKKAVSPWVQFMVTRLSSPDFKHIVVNERMKLISQEWKALDESEKQVRRPQNRIGPAERFCLSDRFEPRHLHSNPQKYKDLSSQDADRYASEYNSVFGHSPTQAQAAASAVA